MSFKDSKFVFPKWANYIPLLILVFGGGGLVSAHFIPFFLSAEVLEVNYNPDQPIPFSHKLHAGKLGLDCRLCHSGADKSFEAMVPTTSVCMTCHNTVKKDSPLLKPLRDAHRAGKGITWTRVYDLPDYVKFPHQAHVQAGLDCQKCHGPVEEMDVVRVVPSMSMSWCLTCHRKAHYGVDKLVEQSKEDLEGLSTSDKIRKLSHKYEISELMEILANQQEEIAEGNKIERLYSVSWEEALAKHDGKVWHKGTRDLASVKDFAPPIHCSGCHQ